MCCKHVPDAKVLIRSECCRRFFECSACHDEHFGAESARPHEFRAAEQLVFKCMACEQPFRKIMHGFAVEDEACPHCSAQYFRR